MFDRLTAQNDILSAAMQAAVVRNDIIQNNIANGDVAGYKKKTVLFEDALECALRSAEFGGELDLSKAVPQIKVIHENYSYRLDGNNVDMETEMMDLYKNSVRYDTLANGVMSNYKRINLVLSAR